MSIAEFYGLAYQQKPAQSKTTAECVKCGTEITEQQEVVMYECERCMNEHAE